MKNIAFFLSAQNIDKKYSEPALALIKLCVEQGYGFVYGGSEYGLMKTASRLVKKLGGTITAISSEEFRSVLTDQADKTYVAKNISQRKEMFIQKSDVIVALPGGAGTLDEITDIIAKKKLGLHNKPIIFLNTDGFWDGLKMQYQRMYSEGFLLKNPDDLFFVDDNPNKILEFIERV